MFVPRFPPFVFLSGIDRCFDGIHKFSRFSLLVYTHIVCIYIFTSILLLMCQHMPYHTVPYRTDYVIRYIALHCITLRHMRYDTMT
jgi:hypothetical protein